MARALLIGCGCCARIAGASLRERGWAVRGTSREATGAERIEGAGMEGVVADPDRVGDLVDLLGDVSVAAWCLGRVDGGPEREAALAAQRLPSFLEKLVDTPVRGLVLERDAASEAGNTAERHARDAAGRWRIPVELMDADRTDPSAWAARLTAAVEAALGG